LLPSVPYGNGSGRAGLRLALATGLESPRRHGMVDRYGERV
jgi:hypothetical protein